METRVIIELTTKCNLGCKYCYNGCNTCGDDMDFELFQEIVKKIKTVKQTCKVVLTGGEPICCPEISLMLAELKRNDIKSIIYTNGLLLTQKNLDEFKFSGVEKIQVSLDGVNEESNSFRNMTQDKINKVCKAIMMASSYKEFSVDLSCVLSNINYQQVDNFLKFANKNNLKVVFSLLSPEGNACEGEMHLNKQQVREVLLRLDKLKPDYNFTMPSCGLGGSCPALTGNRLTPYIDYKGNVYPCIGLRDKVFCLGNVMNHGFTFDFTNNLILNTLKEVLVARGNLMKHTYCKNCFYNNASCNGGCLSNSIIEKNNYFIQSDKCEAYAFYGKYNFIKNYIN